MIFGNGSLLYKTKIPEICVFLLCGEGPPVPATPDFESGTFDHSDISPGDKSENPACAGLLLFSGELGFRTICVPVLLRPFLVVFELERYE